MSGRLHFRRRDRGTSTRRTGRQAPLGRRPSERPSVWKPSWLALTGKREESTAVSTATEVGKPQAENGLVDVCVSVLIKVEGLEPWRGRSDEVL